MEFLLSLFVEYGPYLGIIFTVNFAMLGLKKGFKDFFSSVIGLRLAFLIPLVLGGALGLLLGLDSWKTCVLTGMGLGAASHYVYKFFTRTLKNKEALEKLSELKDEISE